MSSNPNYEQLLERIHQIHDLDKAESLLRWDRQVNMPPQGAQARTQQLTTLGRIRHNAFTSNEIGDLIEAASTELNGSGYDSNEASLIRYLRYDYNKSRKLPSEFVARNTKISNPFSPICAESGFNCPSASVTLRSGS